MPEVDRIRIAAIADMHCGSPTDGALPDFSHLAEGTDLLLIAGDLTDHGLPHEAENLLKRLIAIKVPVVAVLGNHDYEAGRHEEVREILLEGGVHILDGEAREFEGVGIAGVKGFAGGFGRRMLAAWGEPAMKAFVQESVDEAIKLETALARLRTQHVIALLHYSPIQGTVEGEPPEIFPFLGSSRLEEPLNRYSVTAAFHGHAHRGRPEGQTHAGIPVYNVSLPLLSRTFPDQPPVKILELDKQPNG